MREEAPQLPLSPYDEGFTQGLLNVEYKILHFDGQDHMSFEIPGSVDPVLAERADFLAGIAAGVRLSRRITEITQDAKESREMPI